MNKFCSWFLFAFSITVIMLSYTNNSLKLVNRVNSLSRPFGLSMKAASTAIPSLTKSSISSIQPIQHPSYQILESTIIKEYGLQATLYSHQRTGAQVISVIAPQDDNKVFGISFRTPPDDSTGLPHILEHSVLCGSRKYPVKEPFVDLLKGSLQNFLNAFTYPDRTCYPVASTNTKDFYNLVNVYLDAVLHPRAMNDPMVLQQEGWHYEIDSDDSGSDNNNINSNSNININKSSKEPSLSIKGVVYNEMKGVYSSPDSLLGRATQQALFPDNTYGVDSGGDPNVIPTLTYDKFKNFHSTYYHPSNSRIFFYGNDDPMKRLELLDEYLSDFTSKSVDSKIKFQPQFHSPREVTVKFPVDATTSTPKHMISLNWVMNFQPISMKEQLAIGVLDSLLVGTSTSALRKELTQSNLGESMIGGGLSDELLQATFSVGLKGVLPENVKKVEELVLKTLKDLTIKGFESDAIEAAINTMEFRLREFNTGGFPRGLSLMLGMLPNWIYEKNPFDGVRFEEALKELKEELVSGKPIFQDLLKKYLVENTHRVRAEAIPDNQLEMKQQQEEKEKLNAIKSSLTKEQIKSIVEASEILREAQLKEDSSEAKASIPRLSLEDIDRQTKEIPIKVEILSDHNVKLVTHDIQSNGILYTDVAFDMSAISFEDLPYLPLFIRMLTEAGTLTYDEVTLSRKIGSQTGGISASMHTDIKHESNGVVSTGDDALFYLIIRGKATEEKVPILMNLVSDIILNSKLDNQRRAIEILRESKARKESSVITSGHSFAATRLAARHSFIGYVSEQLSGVTSVRQAATLLQTAEQNWPEIESRLKHIRDKVFKKNNVIINLTAGQTLLDSTRPAILSFLSTLSSQSTKSSELTIQQQWKTQKSSRLLPLKNEGFSVPSQVNYVLKGGQLFQPGEKVSGAFKVITRYLSNSYLWDNVRVVGGAYGGFAQFSEITGRLSFASYRDPNLVKTLEIYDNAPQALHPEEVPPESLKDSIIGTIGDMDSPQSPDQKGYSSFVEYISGENPEDRQRFREQVLATNIKDVEEYSNRLQDFSKRATVVVFGSQTALEQANKEISTPLVVESAIQG